MICTPTEDFINYRIYRIKPTKEGVFIKYNKIILNKYVAHNILQMMGVEIVEHVSNAIPITKKVFFQITLRKTENSHMYKRIFVCEVLVPIDKIQRKVEMVYDDFSYTNEIVKSNDNIFELVTIT